jgi:regulator of protease activity HflC (stomatin/prohibitin superfamily)
MITDKPFRPGNGFLYLFLFFLLFGAAVWLTVTSHPAWAFLALIPILMLIGFFIVNPNDSKVLVLFGKYAGTVSTNGFFWSNPFFSRSRLSLRARNLEGDKIKVNDKMGNPIVISAVVVWKVDDSAKAKFEVDNYEQYVKLQTDAAIRHLASSYSYDHFDDDQKEITLRSGGEHINDELIKELTERLARSGVGVLEARITHLAYAEEIAGAMLQRQQASAVIAARTKIVDGAVGMVQMALTKLSKEQIVELDEEKKAAMVSNLLVVLCSDKAASPVVNTGTLYH